MTKEGLWADAIAKADRDHNYEGIGAWAYRASTNKNYYVLKAAVELYRDHIYATEDKRIAPRSEVLQFLGVEK